jgi:hypothetical protein
MATEEITSSDDLINVSDLRARVADLKARMDETHDGDAGEGLEDWEADELAALTDLEAQVGGYGDSKTLIRETYMPRFAEEEAESLYGFESGDWPFHLIDWDRAAGELAADYASVSFKGETYLIRS